MTFTVFVLENSFHTLLQIQFHLLVMDTENSLWGKNKLLRGKKKGTLSDIWGVKRLKNTFLHRHPLSNSLKTDGQVATSLRKTSLWVTKATSAGLTWFLGILNPGFYFC